MYSPGNPEEEDILLAPKVLNNGTTPTLQRFKILLNGYQLDLSNAVQEVYQFELRFQGVKAPRRQEQAQPEPVDLARGPKNDVSKETRRRLLWQLYQQLLARNQDVFGNDKLIYVYDCGQLLFARNDLGIPVDQSREFLLDVDRAALEQRCSYYIRNYERITATLARTGTVNLRNAAAAYVQGDRSVVQFLELLTTQRLFELGQHYIFGNRMYERDSVIRLGGGGGGGRGGGGGPPDPRILKAGMQKNVRFVGDNVRNSQPIVQIDPKKSAFFPTISLIDFVGDFFNFRSPQELAQRFQSVFERARKQIHGLVLETTHLPTQQIVFSANGLTPESASELTFEREGRQVSVAQHIEETYQLRLRYPNLPCVIQKQGGGGSRNNYYPMECLQIVQGQRVSIDKQTPNLTEQMIRQCQVLPENVPAQIDEQRDKAMVQNGNPYFQKFGIRMATGTNLINTDASLLYPPAIQYKPEHDVVEPDGRGVLKWAMIGQDVPRDRQYTMPAKWPRRWAVVIVQHAVQMDACRNFVDRIIQAARQRGLGDVAQPNVYHFHETSLQYVDEQFQLYRHHSCMFVLFFAPGKRNAHPGDIHHVMKLMEQRHEILTQHISPEIMQKGSQGGGGAAMVIENILFKTNLKLGGANYNIVTSRLYRQASRNPEDVVGNHWLSGNRMFFGIAMSHAPPQAMYERRTGAAIAIPTVVGMAYTVGKAILRMRGTYWMQQPRVATMTRDERQPFVRKIIAALENYEMDNGRYPEHIIAFRGGASEGEFKQICRWEGAAFVDAFFAIKKQSPTFQEPAVTMVVCQRQSNYRIIPENIRSGARAPEQNVQPGTIVDSRVMNAALSEFLLVAHKAQQGTAQPVRCTIIYEYRPEVGPHARIQSPIALEEIENITNALCYSHGICCMSTAVPGVLYAADELAKRGRNNWKMHSEDGATAPQFELPPLGEGQEQAQLHLNQQRSEYFARVSSELHPTIPTKFWA